MPARRAPPVGARRRARNVGSRAPPGYGLIGPAQDHLPGRPGPRGRPVAPGRIGPVPLRERRVGVPRHGYPPGMTRPRTLALVLAGGKGGRLELLTEARAKPAVPFGGSYRLVDVVLSNCLHSGISDVWVSVQHQPGVAGGPPGERAAVGPGPHDRRAARRAPAYDRRRSGRLVQRDRRRAVARRRPDPGVRPAGAGGAQRRRGVPAGLRRGRRGAPGVRRHRDGRHHPGGPGRRRSVRRGAGAGRGDHPLRPQAGRPAERPGVQRGVRLRPGPDAGPAGGARRRRRPRRRSAGPRARPAAGAGRARGAPASTASTGTGGTSGRSRRTTPRTSTCWARTRRSSSTTRPGRCSPAAAGTGRPGWDSVPGWTMPCCPAAPGSQAA